MKVNSYLVRIKTFIKDISVTRWYHPVPNHQKRPDAAFPVHNMCERQRESLVRKNSAQL